MEPDLDSLWSVDPDSEQCCGSGSGIRCFSGPWIRIRDGKNRDSGFRIRDENLVSYLWNLSNPLWVNLLKFFAAVPEPGTFRPWILDEKDPDPQDCYVDIGPCYYYAKTSTGNATYTVLYFIPTVYRSQKLRSDQIMISNHVSTFFNRKYFLRSFYKPSGRHFFIELYPL
jgi:hypothetical protein